jgi:hypothetical protein
MNARALAIKVGKILGELLSKKVFGSRPVTLTGYSLGSLVIFEALKYLASLPASSCSPMIQDVYIFGAPVTIDPALWASIRRLVAGRLVNGYSTNDYVLGVICRVSNMSWKVAGLHPIDAKGVENVLCEHIDGHLKWRSNIGKSLQLANVTGISDDRVEIQLQDNVGKMDEDDLAAEMEVFDIQDYGPDGAGATPITISDNSSPMTQREDFQKKDNEGWHPLA